jgi:hypothetical protein
LKISSSHCKKLPIGSTGLATYNLATLLSKFSPINKFKLNTNARQIAHENSVASSDVDIEIISVSSEDISLPKTSLTESHNRKPSLSALIEEKKISLQQAKDKLKKHEDEMARVSRLTKKSLRNLGGFYQGMSESKRSSFKNEVDQAKLRLFIAQHQAVAMTDKRNPKFENWHNPFSILCYAWKMESKARKAKLLASKEIGPLKYEFKRMNSWIFRNDPLSALKNENVVSPAAAQENQAAYEPQQDLTDIKVRNARSSQHMTMQRKMNTALNTENVKTNQPSIIRSDLTDSLNRIKTKGKFLVGSVRRGFSMPRLPSQNKEVIEVPLRASTLPKSAPKLNVHINEINFWQNQDIIRLLNPE